MHSHPSSPHSPLSRLLREPSVRTATPRVPPPRRDEEASLHQQQQQERPSRNGAALCPEFVPRRSSCSFTRGDKSEASLSRALLPTPRCLPDLTCAFPFLSFPYVTSRKLVANVLENYHNRKIGMYGRLLLCSLTPHFWDDKGTRGREGCRA